MNNISKSLNTIFVKRQLPWKFRYLIQPFVSSRFLHLFGQKYLNLRSAKIEAIKPTLAIIGAQKAGTSSLHSYLSNHPEIFMSHIKEPGLYLDQHEAAQNDRIGTPDQVLKIMLHGYKGEKVFGEGSTYYTKAPSAGENVAKNMALDNPDIKLIYILRNPFGRIISQYLHYLDTGRMDCSFEEFITSESTHLPRSLYFYQLKRFLEHFKPEQIKLILFEEMIADTPKILREVCEFLSVNPEFKFPAAGVVNRSKSRDKVQSENLRIPREKYQAMRNQIETDKQEIEELLGRKISCWELSEEKWC